jgi:hypothetical protein
MEAYEKQAAKSPPSFAEFGESADIAEAVYGLIGADRFRRLFIGKTSFSRMPGPVIRVGAIDLGLVRAIQILTPDIEKAAEAVTGQKHRITFEPDPKLFAAMRKREERAREECQQKVG